MSGLFGGGQKATQHATRAMGIDFQGAQYGPPVPVMYGQNKVAGNCIWYGDFQSKAQSQQAGKGGGGGSTTSYTYSASAQMGLCEGPVTSLNTVYNGTSVINLSSLNYAFATGTKGQAPWSHLSGADALGYTLTSIFSFQNLALGSSPSLPNYNYELVALLPFSQSTAGKNVSSTINDANPADIVSDICSNEYHGINFPWLGSMTQYSDYCIANSLFLSPVYSQQQSASQTLSDLFKYTNAYVYYSEDQLKIVPLGDVAVTGNGVTYTPNNTPVVNLGTNDFIVDSGGASITVDRTAPQDAINLERVEFTDRSNTYHTGAVVAAIDDDVVANGERSDTSDTVNGCTSAAVARFIAQNLVQRKFFIRNTYQFKLSWRYCYLEPTDIVTLTDASMGLNEFPVRITSVEEDGDSGITIEAEEFPEGIGHSALYNTQPNGGTNVDQNADPGAVNAPFIFRGPGNLVDAKKPEIWCAVNGSNALWAGAEVYLSHDGSSYTYCGTIATPARYGELTTALPTTSSDPDTTNTPSVGIFAPAALLGGSQTDADNFVTMAMVDTEIIAYETATLTGSETYELSYLRRGGYASGVAAHAIGAPFVRLDDAIFRIPVDPSLIGSTVYMKFLSLNCFGRTPRTLADETAYTYVVGTNEEWPDVPEAPSGFAGLAVADGVSLTWTLPNPAATASTSIERSTDGTTWAVLAQVGNTSNTFTDHYTTGGTYYYRARSRGSLLQAGYGPYTGNVEATATNVSGTGGLAVSVSQPGANLVVNPSFGVGAPGSTPATWSNTGIGPSWAAQGNQYAGFPAPSCAAVSINSTTATLPIIQSAPFSCTPGVPYSAQIRYSIHGALTGGTLQANIQWLNSSGASVGYSPVMINSATAGSPTSFVQATSENFTPPSGAVTGVFRAYGYEVKSASLVYLIVSQIKVEVGAVCTPYTDDATQLGNQLTVAGSGQQMGDQRNMNSITWGGVRSVNSASPITYTSQWNATYNTYFIELSVAAYSLYAGSGVTINYGAAGTIVSQAASTTETWYLYFLDPAGAGGTPAVNATTSIQTVAQANGAVLIGYCPVTVPAAGGASGGGSGSGGGGWCVADDMFIRPGKRAGDAEIGDEFDCIDLPSESGKHVRTLRGVSRGVEECVRLITDDGCALTCSLSTPFDTHDGRQVLAGSMLGERVVTDLHEAAMVITATLVGPRPVTRAHLGGVSYAAGSDPTHRIYSHNSGTQLVKP